MLDPSPLFSSSFWLARIEMSVRQRWSRDFWWPEGVSRRKDSILNNLYADFTFKTGEKKKGEKRQRRKNHHPFCSPRNAPAIAFLPSRAFPMGRGNGRHPLEFLGISKKTLSPFQFIIRGRLDGGGGN